MSSVYNPRGALPNFAVAGQQLFPITSSTNTSPIVVNISAGPGTNDQDTVEVSGHQTNTNANGVWTVTKISPTQYSLNGSVGNGVGGATGKWQDFSLTPAISIPGDGDLASAGSINPAFEGTADMAPFLYRLTGAYRLINVYSATFGNSTVAPVPAYGSTTTASASFVNVTGQTAILATALGGLFTGTPLQTNDLLQYTASWMWSDTGGSKESFTTLGFEKNGGSYSQVLGAPSMYGQGSPGNSWATVDGSFQPGSANTFDFSMMILNITGGSNTFQFFGSGTLRVNHYRLNG